MTSVPTVTTWKSGPINLNDLVEFGIAWKAYSQILNYYPENNSYLGGRVSSNDESYLNSSTFYKSPYKATNDGADPVGYIQNVTYTTLDGFVNKGDVFLNQYPLMMGDHSYLTADNIQSVAGPFVSSSSPYVAESGEFSTSAYSTAMYLLYKISTADEPASLEKPVNYDQPLLATEGLVPGTDSTLKSATWNSNEYGTFQIKNSGTSADAVIWVDLDDGVLEFVPGSLCLESATPISTSVYSFTYNANSPASISETRQTGNNFNTSNVQGLGTTIGDKATTNSTTSKTISTSNTATVSASMDIPDVASVSVSDSQTEGYKNAWSNSWGQTQSASRNISTQQTTGSTELWSATSVYKKTIPSPNEAQAGPDVQGKFVFKDEDGVDVYFHPGTRYEVIYSYGKGSFTSKVTGQAQLQGRAAIYSTPDTNNPDPSTTLSIAAAARIFEVASASESFGYGYEFKPEYSSSPGDNPYVKNNTFIGKLMDSADDSNTPTSVTFSQDITVHSQIGSNQSFTMAAVSTNPSSSSTTSSTSFESNALVSADGQADSSSSSTAQSFKSTFSLLDGLDHAPESSNMMTSHTGSDQSEKIFDTRGKDRISTQGGDDHVEVSGNTIHDRPDNTFSGDYVDTGDGNDTVDASKVTKDSFGITTVFSGNGDDLVIGGDADTTATLGAGNDRYVYGGGNDFATLGEGADLFTIKNFDNESNFAITDFNVAEDRIEGLNPDSVIVWEDAKSRFVIQTDGFKNSYLLTNNDNNISESPDYWIGFALQNGSALKYQENSNLFDWKLARQKWGENYDSKLVSSDFSGFSQNDDSVNEAARLIAATGAGLSREFNALNSADYAEIRKIAKSVDRFTDFLAITAGYIHNKDRLNQTFSKSSYQLPVTVDGTSFNDVLTGGEGFDILNGNAGDDSLTSGTKHSVMTGGAGADHFSVQSGEVYITDFNYGDGDTIGLENIGKGNIRFSAMDGDMAVPYNIGSGLLLSFDDGSIYFDNLTRDSMNQLIDLSSDAYS